VPIPHADVIEALIQSLGYRNIEVVKDEYALTPDFMRMFGVMTVNVEHSGVRLALGIGIRTTRRQPRDHRRVQVFVCDT